ncbi:CHASE domain-containing protein [Aliiruegeria sabulilitoris]|uniref:CHASE domain-containing protein n=1 Tax=Aliiruegeria sabulilitoris TaxID=1510458 RepID=UPI00082A534E|nr:CHASE domain-containing protein [Aliiruegeria sabulilitoris]NDR58800.1 hypothetical protein [Pseudoruegeria sp. M32A2M]
MSGTQRVRKVAVASAFLAILLTILVSSMIRMAQADRVASVVRTFSGVFTAKMEEQLRARLSLSEIMQQAIANGLVENPDDFRSLSETFHHRFKDLQAVNWVGTTGRIEQVTPLEGNEEALGLDLLGLVEPRLALEDSARIDRLRITPPITLAQGGRGLTAYAPVRANGEITGYINLVFRIEPMIKTVLGEEAADSFNVSVFDGTEPLYVQEGETGSNPHAIETPIEVGGRTWTTTITPTAAEVAKAQTFLDEAILVAGFLLSIFLATILNGAARNRETLAKSEERFSLAM